MTLPTLIARQSDDGNGRHVNWRVLGSAAWAILLALFGWFATLTISRIDRLEERVTAHAIEIEGMSSTYNAYRASALERVQRLEHQVEKLEEARER